MKKFLVILLVLSVILAVPAYALEAAEYARPDLYFSRSNAVCYLYVAGASDAEISATMTLMENNRRVARWSETGTGTLVMNETHPAISGSRYTLICDIDVDGSSMECDTLVETCP